MGCEMHIYTEQYKNGMWVAVDENYEQSNYKNMIVGTGKTEYEAMDNYLGEYASKMGIKS